MRNRKSFNKKIMFYIVIFVIALCIIIALVSNILRYKNADTKMEQYNDLLNDVYKAETTEDVEESVVEITTELSEDEIAEFDTDTGETLGDYNKRMRGIKESESDANLRERIDFTELETLLSNQDANGWLYLPDTSIDYVVMQGPSEDPFRYLWKDPYGENSDTGSLFVVDTGDEDDHTIIYGHRLKNHELYFGVLMAFLDESYAKEHQVAYFYESDKVTRYKLYSVNEGLETDSIYYYPYVKSTADYLYLLQDVKNGANFTFRENFDENNRMLVLSTCSGNMGGQPQRLYLVFEEDVVYEY